MCSYNYVLSCSWKSGGINNGGEVGLFFFLGGAGTVCVLVQWTGDAVRSRWINAACTEHVWGRVIVGVLREHVF